MAVNLKLYDEDDNEITLLDGIDFGLTRMRYPVVKKMYLRNLGNDNAKNLTITVDTLNKKEDISNEEYEKQVKAKNWKSFSLDNKNFSEILDLGKVLKGSYYEGIKEVKFDLTSSKGTLKEEWTNAVPNFIDSKLVFRKTTYENFDKNMRVNFYSFVEILKLLTAYKKRESALRVVALSSISAPQFLHTIIYGLLIFHIKT